ITVLMVMVAFMPFLTIAEPTRAGEAELTGVIISGSQAPGGEYAPGLMFISVEINNTGVGEFIDWVDLTVNITYVSNDTVFHVEVVPEMVYIPADHQAVVELINLTMEEDVYDISVNATIGIVETSVMETIVVMGVVDTGVENIGFDEESYPPGEEMVPICNVTYEGNVQSFADTLEVDLVIDRVEDSITVYNETLEILTPASPGVKPGHYWLVSFPGWVPLEAGDYEATFAVFYDTYNEVNNQDVVPILIDNPIAVEGYAVTDAVDPIPGVSVTIDTIPEKETTTDTDGYYFFSNITEGNYTLEFAKQWVTSYETNVTIVAGETQVINATMTPLMVGGLRGNVALPDAEPAGGALVIVTMAGYPFFTINTNSTGYYQMDDLPAGNATVTASLSGYVDAEESIILASQAWNTLNLQLGEIPFNVSFSVPDGEPAFPVFDSISVFFTRPIERSTVDQNSLVLRKLTTATTVDAVYSFTDNDETIVITPDRPLDHSTDYQIEVTSWITDINGDWFPGPVTTMFTTEIEIIEIQMENIYPADDAPEIPITATISAKFPVPMNGSTVNGTTFKMFAQGGVVIDAVVTYQASTYTAFLDPISDLEYGTRYSVTLDPDMLAVDNEYVFYGEQWSFETEVLVTKGTLTGKVVDENNVAFLSSQVTILLKTGSETTLTRRPQVDGTFEIIDLDAGLWTITVQVTGYKEYTQQVTIEAGGITQITQTILLEVEDEQDGEGGDELNIWIFVVIGMAVLLVIIVLWLAYNRRQEPVEAEEMGRGPAFGAGRREPMHHEGYDEFAEGEFLCPACGSVVEGEDEICPACGAEFEEDLFECPECGASIPANAEECPECGSIFEEEVPEDEDEDFYDEEEVDITEDFEVEDMDEDDIPIPDVD
ncbi:MAG: carboxypeptidase regulatory-like domain-containing protein, partial [Candidatus Thermoplasmatota archaeon]|nr:carboxypeptidase regulatory-like domain-containing protein [Candidatus Thermoplasmatota archaeon]